MAIIQDQNASKEKYSTKREPASMSKIEKEWTYNEIYLPCTKYEENKSSKGSKEIFKMETTIDNKNSMEKVA